MNAQKFCLEFGKYGCLQLALTRMVMFTFKRKYSLLRVITVALRAAINLGFINKFYVRDNYRFIDEVCRLLRVKFRCKSIKTHAKKTEDFQTGIVRYVRQGITHFITVMCGRRFLVDNSKGIHELNSDPVRYAGKVGGDISVYDPLDLVEGSYGSVDQWRTYEFVPLET